MGTGIGKLGYAMTVRALGKEMDIYMEQAITFGVDCATCRTKQMCWLYGDGKTRVADLWNSNSNEVICAVPLAVERLKREEWSVSNKGDEDDSDNE